MDRIGIAASKIAKGNIIFYNAYVVLLIFLFALFIFLIAGSAMMLALVVLSHVIRLLPQNDAQGWNQARMICLSSLTIVVGFFSIMAAIRNLKIKFPSSGEGHTPL